MSPVRARNVYLGVDLGTTALKAALFEARSGRLIAGASERIETTVLAGGEREQDASRILAAIDQVLSRLRRISGARWKAIAGAALSSQGGSAVIAEGSSGRPLTPLWPWNDSRPFKYLPGVVKSLGRDFWRRRTMRDDPGAGLGRMLWLKGSRPRLMSARNIYAGAGEFVFFHLTGVWRQDAGSALQVGCYDAARRRLMREPMDVVGAPLSFVAPMRQGHGLCEVSAAAARRFGLPEGLPVAGPYMDHEAGFMAAAGVSSRPLECSLGTAWVGNFLMAEGAKWASPIQLVIPSPVGGGWQVIQPLLTGNVTWEWGLVAFAHGNMKKALAEAQRILGSDSAAAGITFIPWLGRPNPFAEGAFGAGVFLGLSPSTSHGDMLRALAEGMAFEFYRVFEEVHRQRIVDSLVLGGGAAGAAFFRSIFAALFHPLPMYVFEDHEFAGARGAIRPFDADAAKAPVRKMRPASAKVARAARKRYSAYRRVFERIYGDEPLGGAVRILGT